MSLFDEVKRNLVEWYGVAADKTGVAAKVGARKYDIFGISRDIERQFSEIGDIVYNGIESDRSDILEDPVLLELVEKVRKLEKEMASKQAEIADIKTADSEIESDEVEEIVVEIVDEKPVDSE
ncbi:MAG: hypothetical protein GY752_02645 [bacterium]|nr:hypothetical protein [bacterium]MCP4799366.1 hypothetical protein [bacterium]